MKIRNGFVSNSSSSSFVVAFPHVPQSVEEVEELLFGAHYGSYYPQDEHRLFNKQAVAVEIDGEEFIRARAVGIFLTTRVAKTVWEDIQEQKPNDKDAIMDILSRNSSVNYVSFRNQDGSTDWGRYNRECRRVAAIEAKQTMKEWKYQIVYTFCYSDNNGHYGSAMEHGGLFNSLPHKQISEH